MICDGDFFPLDREWFSGTLMQHSNSSASGSEKLPSLAEGDFYFVTQIVQLCFCPSFIPKSR